MVKYDDLKFVRTLSRRGDTNSQVDLFKEENGDKFFVRKGIFGIDQPLYQAIFMREVRALYKLNNCPYVVKIKLHDTRSVKDTHEKVGIMFLEYIAGQTLAKIDLKKLSPKEKFKIIKQLLIAIESAHSNGIIHRDINPNNIMIDNQGDVKVIDFGICKIKEMVTNSTVYRMGTNLYSAPEVHLHSDNATERSDLYSIGAIIYYLFTGNEPPVSDDFQDVLDDLSGIDVSLKPIIKKLVSVDPDERYSDIYSLRVDLTEILERFLNINLQINISIDHEKFHELKKMNFIPYTAKVYETHFITQNFSDLYAFKTENDIFSFLGSNYIMECIYCEDLNIFSVVNFKKIMPIDRENLKKRYTQISAKFNFVLRENAHRQSRNDSFEIKNIIDNYYADFKSKKNVDYEFKSKYGTWKDLLLLIKKSIEESAIKFTYDSYKRKDGFLFFDLCKGIFLPENMTKEQVFIYEKNSKKTKNNLIAIGSYEDDYFEKDHVVLKIKPESSRYSIPSKGFFCCDYRKDLINVQRQIEALEIIEREDYSCTFELKEIISGVQPPTSKDLKRRISYLNKQLDLSQKAAVEKVLDSESFCIVQGPPGTGKTNVIIEIIRQILKDNVRNPDLQKKKILLVSQSHPAVDKMIDDLVTQSDEKPNLIRIGRDEKLNNQIREEYGINYVKTRWMNEVEEKCLSVSQNYYEEMGIEKCDFDSYYNEFEKQFVSDFKSEINKDIIDDFKLRTSGNYTEKLRKILEIQRQWIDRLPNCEDADLYIIKAATIIAGTCMGFISNKVIRDVDFDYLIIDEAAKATFPELAVSFNKAEKIIMVGDHKQLPPVLDTDIINENKKSLDTANLYEGIFEKLYNIFPEENKHRLTVQYRMHPTIGTLISKIFYENEIQNGIDASKRIVGIDKYSKTAIEWISTSDRPEKERYEKKMGAYPNYTFKNDLEINIIIDKLKELDDLSKKELKVGVITAYSAQKSILKELVRQQQYSHLKVEVDTVDAFQGSQKEIIIYSTVRSSSNPKQIGFLKSEARLNVAFSRAQSLLIIVGDHNFLNNAQIHQNKFPEIIEYISQTEGCKIEKI